MNPERKFERPEPARSDLASRIEGDAHLRGIREAMASLPRSEWFLVGGAVRDDMLGRESIKDYDFVVRKADIEDVRKALSSLGAVDMVGRNFGVLKFYPRGSEGEAIDVAWPRTETAGGSGGYRDFDVQSDPDLPIADDLARRDLTINAMAWDVRKKRLVDPHKGRQDVENRVLRAVGEAEDRFREDYSRMLRTIRFACQLGFEIEKGTWDAIVRSAPNINNERTAMKPVKDRLGRERGQKEIRERVVPHETIAKEVAKAFDSDALRCIELLEGCGLMFRIIPEMEPTRGCEQSPEHHSEGDVWTHTRLVVAALGSEGFAKTFPGERPTVEVKLAAMFHDVGKPDTMRREEDGVITFYGHPDRGAEIVRAIEERIRFSSVSGHDIDKERLMRLVKFHLLPNTIDLDSVRPTTLERHFLKDERFGRELLHLAYADVMGRIPQNREPDPSHVLKVMERLEELKERRGDTAEKPPFLRGEFVMKHADIGEGPEVGRLMEALSDAFLKGDIRSEQDAVDLLKDL